MGKAGRRGKSHPCWVTSTCGLNALDLRDDRVECPQPASSSVPAGSAMFTVVPRALGPPISVCRPVPGNNVLPDSMQRHRHHSRVVVEDVLHAVTVMDVDIDIADSLDALL